MKIENIYLKAGQKQVVIIGGGFAGLAAAKVLAHQDEVHVILVDQRNHHLFQPLLYQVATAGLNPADIAMPIRSLFARVKNIAVHLSHVKAIDPKEKMIRSSDGKELGFDYLIIACGAHHSYFGKPEWEDLAPGLKTLEQATEMRRRILYAFELAENEIDPVRQKTLLTFLIVGGGPTGVELAGAIADISRTVLIRDFRRIDPASARVVLLEAGPRLLASFDAELSERAAQDLKKLGVEVRCNTRVEHMTEQGASVNSGEVIAAGNMFWAAGVQAEEISQTLRVTLDRAGRILVAPDLSLPDYPNIFAVGDIAHVELPGGKVLPGMAPAAIQTGRAAALNILASVRGQERRAFRYRDKGQMATIGKSKAIAEMDRLKLTGFVAWLAWLFVHILYLVGFRNRVMVLFDWVWSYVFSRRGARLITSRTWKK